MSRPLETSAVIRRLQQEYGVRFDASLRNWLHYHQSDVVFSQVSWMGVPTQKNVLDCWVYQEILYEVRPDIILEIGSNTGGSTLFLANMLDLLRSGTIVSIDIDRAAYRVTHPRIIILTGDSASPEIVERARALCAGKRVLVIHDGDHFAAQVAKDLEAYAPLVSIGSYLIVEDGIVDVTTVGGEYIRPGEGPLVAVEDFLAAHPEFVADETRERYLVTYNPRGYLKRTR